MQANRYVKLPESEILTLEAGVKNDKRAYFRMPCEGLLLSKRSYKVEEIARLFEVRTHTVRSRMNRWESEAMAGLTITEGRGRKGTISVGNVAVVEALQAQVGLHPQSFRQWQGKFSSNSR